MRGFLFPCQHTRMVRLFSVGVKMSHRINLIITLTKFVIAFCLYFLNFKRLNTSYVDTLIKSWPFKFSYTLFCPLTLDGQPECELLFNWSDFFFSQLYTIQQSVNPHLMTFNFCIILSTAKPQKRSRSFWWLLQTQRRQKLTKACWNGWRYAPSMECSLLRFWN